MESRNDTTLLFYKERKECDRLLCLWLPFTDGTTKNYGLINDGITTGVTPTFINDGKLGKCLNQGQIDMSADTTAKILNNQELTICFWLYVNAEEGSTTKRAMLFGNSGTGVNDNRKFSLFQYPTCNDLHLSWMNDTANTMFLSGIWQGVLPSYKWTHVTVTYSNPDTIIYINGQIYAKRTGVSNSSSFAYNTRVVWDNAYRYLNDFRIYNTCLSSRQVKEISKGLICHYPLGEVDGKIGGRNLLRQSSLVGEQLICDFISGMNSVTTRQYEEEGYHIVTPSGGNHNNGIGFGYKDFTSLGINQGDTVTFSCDVKGVSDLHKPSIRIIFQANESTWYGSGTFSSNNITLTPLENKWQRVSVTCTLPNEIEWTSKTMWLAIHGNYESNLYIRNLKLEKSSTATPWTPALEDDTSFYDNVIYDTSGYGNNGSVSGDILWDINTPRYKGAYDFNGTGYIKNDNFGVYFKEFTISYWIKVPESISSQHFAWGTFNNFTGNGVGSWRDVNATDCGYSTILRSNTENNYSWFNRVPLLNYTNTWVFLSFIYTGTTLKTYANGKLYGNIVTYGSNGSVYMPVVYLGNSLFNNSPSSETDECSMVDFRIYATALDNQTIEELYKVGASLDSSGNLMLAGEVIEE